MPWVAGASICLRAFGDGKIRRGRGYSGRQTDGGFRIDRFVHDRNLADRT